MLIPLERILREGETTLNILEGQICTLYVLYDDLQS